MSTIPEITPTELNKKLAQVKIIDVRRPDEFSGELGHIAGAILATLETDLDTYLFRLSKDETYVFVCRSGGRSAAATKLAISNGFLKVFNMTGGMLAWNLAGLSVVK
ncbi:MAG: rhodanese-related sulfurtransferase [Bacteriovoracaceae bacterium]|nr:rhodanese-related sulfurtransferase [Bacteriovoracaceae bacterium]